MTDKPNLVPNIAKRLQVSNFEAGYVLPVDKPYAWTSTDVVRKVKTLLRNKAGLKKIKVGHAGTLDPLATGLLIICIGKATKNIETIQLGEKEYVADICFGTTTPSFDLETSPDCHYPFEHIAAADIANAFAGFVGDTEQLPPLFSAKLIAGKRAYDYARIGETPELKPAKINIRSLELIDYKPPVARIRMNCSKGTYVRAFARDLGTALGSGAHLAKLRRTASGAYGIESALSIDEVEDMFTLIDSL
ncbi:MAG: tRNA pseudouridine(55) synthase TruB [Prevotellaceae bacterium]|jgi:tRNA pseudouridine55 synthase|nr:tRNA pseudouridine(55) synthase TruB [Prevotellaceae bacterium]